jgi:hypothetical protein
MVARVVYVESEYVPFAPHQTNFHRSPARFKTLVAGAKGGKTLCAANEVADKGIEQPGYREEQVKRGDPYTIIVGTLVFGWLERVIVPEMMHAVPRELWLSPFTRGKQTFRFRGKKGDTLVYFIHGRPQSWVSFNAHGFWIDEFCQCKEELYDEAMTRVMFNQGWGILSGTPCGPNWAYKRLYEPYTRGEKIDFYFGHWRTIDNPYAPKEEIERHRREWDPQYFNRTYNATWDSYSGQIYEEFHPATHAAKRRSEFTFILPTAQRRQVGDGPIKVFLEKVVAGVDWGFGLGHPGVIVVLGRTKSGTWYLLEESVQEGVVVSALGEADSWVKRARTFRARWDVSAFYCDPSEPEHIQQMVRAGLPAGAADNSVDPGIQCVAKYVHVDPRTGLPRLFVMQECRKSVSEISNYHRRPGTDKPVKVDDHCCDGIRYALFTEEKHGGFAREVGVSIFG